ncbi:MAG: hypothetical protein KAS97_07010 [Candidatus Aminicenantes bacterium]|nr:hypothetical protein [Candidatus Aminicenantes bacterium]
MKYSRIITFFLIISCIILFFGELNARRDQDAAAIARALAKRLTHALDFNDRYDYDRRLIVDVAKAMDSIIFDSLKVNPKYVTVKRIGNSYKLVDRNSHYLLDFGNDNKAARLAWLIFRTYGIERMCFVGRPKSSFNFVLSGGETQVNSSKSFYKVMVPGKAPSGDYPSITSSYKNLKVIKFKNSTLILKYIAGETKYKYRIMSGNRILYHFESEKEAIASYVFIKLYGFNQKCNIYGSERLNSPGITYGSERVNKPMFTFLRKVIKRISLR